MYLLNESISGSRLRISLWSKVEKRIAKKKFFLDFHEAYIVLYDI
jgi:hypothetical protein